MAERALQLLPDADFAITRLQWTGLLNGDTGEAALLGVFGDRSVQVTGTFGAGGSVTLQGSNDGTNWYTLNDAYNAACTFTSAGLKSVLVLPWKVRPSVTAGDGTTSLVVTLFMRSAR